MGLGALRWLGLAGGALLLAAGAGSVLYTLVLPRSHPSRLAETAMRAALRAGRWAADRSDTYAGKDHVLALVGPGALLGLFGLWLAVVYVGYSLVLWPLVPGGPGAAFRDAGSAMLTLGLAGTGSGPISAGATAV